MKEEKNTVMQEEMFRVGGTKKWKSGEMKERKV